MMLKLYNSLSRKPETFKPQHPPAVGLYTCGPTVYNTPHIGNWRAFVWDDLLKRFLEFKGYQVTHVMNLTDVDDKTIKGSIEKGIPLDEFTKKYKNEFFEESKKLGIKPADHYPEATQHIPEMVSLIQKLLEKGFAYKGEDGSIYFSISKFKDYGKLSHLKIKKLKAGARVSQDEYEKQSASDFALWKKWSPEDGNVFWETPLGKGRPGWHIECSAMSMQYLGETFDIHTGGIDNMFPHHENEIAQSEAATGKPFVKYWLHNKHLVVNGQKMAKSLNNFYRLEDLKQFSPKTIRMELLFAHYQKPLDFRLSELEKMDKKRGQLNTTIQRLLEAKNKTENESNAKPKKNGNSPKKNQKLAQESLQKFENALDDDLNTPKAFAALFDFSKKTNQLLDSNAVSGEESKELLKAFQKIDSILGILDFEAKKEESLSSEIQKLIERRGSLRQQKKWVEADQIREELRKKGIELMDKPDGTKWRKTQKQ